MVRRIFVEKLKGFTVESDHLIKDLIEDGRDGILVPIKDSQAIKEKILFLYNNRDVCEQLGKQARGKIKTKSSIKGIGHLWKQMFEDIIWRFV